MKYILPSLVVVAFVLTSRPTPLHADGCPRLFTANSKSSNSYIEYCVSDNGNVTLITTPYNLRLVSFEEGYGLCQESPAIEYHDYAFSQSGWGTAQVVSESSSSIKIKRTTSDGNFSLVQTISKVAKTGSIKILMALTNLQPVAKVVYLLRFAEITNYNFYLGASLGSAWAWIPAPDTPHWGVQLLNAGKSPFGYRQGFVRSTSTLPVNACDFAAGTSSTGLYGPTNGLGGSLIYVYAGSVAGGATQTVTLNYRGM